MGLVKENIVIVSTSRSDFSLVYQIYLKNKTLDFYNINLLVMGSHFEFGTTIEEYLTLKKEKNIILLKQLYKSDTIDNIIYSNQIMQKKFLNFAHNKSIDLIIVLGDRAEIIPIVLTALFLGIKIVHISGGEITRGSLDDRYRHAVTKLADFHFVSSDVYKKRLIQLGEDPERIIVSGPLSIDLVKSATSSKKLQLKSFLKKFTNKKYFLLTLHPEVVYSSSAIDEVIQGLSRFTSQFKIIITGPNSDPNNNVLSNKLKKWSSESENVNYIDNIGHDNFIQVLQDAMIMIGNSSSGFTEAPLLGVPVINIGNRQKGRIEFDGLFNISYNSYELQLTINKIIKEQIISKHHQFTLENSPSSIILQSIKYLNRFPSEKIFVDIIEDCKKLK